MERKRRVRRDTRKLKKEERRRKIEGNREREREK